MLTLLIDDVFDVSIVIINEELEHLDPRATRARGGVRGASNTHFLAAIAEPVVLDLSFLTVIALPSRLNDSFASAS